MENQEEKQQIDQPKSEGIFSKKAVILTTALLVIAVIICISVVGQVLGKGYVSVGGYSLFRVATGSMEPELPVGTLLISKQTDIAEIAEGDVVNFRAKTSDVLGMVITHRVIGVIHGNDGQIYLETKGDANQYPDSAYVDQGNLIGKVTYSTGRGNLFAGLIGILTSPIGFLSCIVLPCLAFGMIAVRDCISNVRKEIDNISRELDEHVRQPDVKQGLDPEEYEQLCQRLRKELLEELKQGGNQVETTE